MDQSVKIYQKSETLKLDFDRKDVVTEYINNQYEDVIISNAHKRDILFNELFSTSSCKSLHLKNVSFSDTALVLLKKSDIKEISLAHIEKNFLSQLLTHLPKSTTDLNLMHIKSVDSQADMLKILENTNITSIKISYSSFTTQDIEAFLKKLQCSNTIKTLSLTNNNFRCDALQHSCLDSSLIASLIEANTSINYMHIDHIFFGPNNSKNQLIKAFGSNHYLTSFQSSYKNKNLVTEFIMINQYINYPHKYIQDQAQSRGINLIMTALASFNILLPKTDWEIPHISDIILNNFIFFHLINYKQQLINYEMGS